MQEWRGNGELAGTMGLSKLIEDIGIKFVEENLSAIVIDAWYNFGGYNGSLARASN